MKKTPLTFECDLETIEVTLNLKGKARQCELRQLTGEGRDEYLQLTGSRIEFGSDGGKAKVKDFKGLQAELLSLCLFDTSSQSPLTMEELQALPARVQTKLFKAARELNGLNDDAEEVEGNE